MGVYLNPGNDAFQRACNSEIYVDKTRMIALTNKVIDTKQNCICVSRPRRFGKSTAAEMLAAYYGRNCDSYDMFQPYKIAGEPDFAKHLNRYNVIFLNVQNAFSRVNTIEEVLQYIQKEILAELREVYCARIPEKEKILSAALEKLYIKSKEKFIFILDEWDCIFRIKNEDKEAQNRYLDFLRDLLKDKNYVSLAYMTGILPIKKYGFHSALNMFDEYSMTNPGEYAEYIGFTEGEVKGLCHRYQVDFEKEKEWYDGYVFENDLHIYNPKAVVDSVRRKRISSYWTQTETYEALKLYIDMNFDGLKDAVIQMLAGEKIVVNTDKFQNDMTTFGNRDDVLTLLVHLGYLAFDGESSQVLIPNAEILGEFRNAIEGEHWKEVVHCLEKSEQLLQATWNKNEKMVAEIIDEIHQENTSILTYNNENALSCIISLAYYNAVKEYSRYRELPSGKGFADIVFLPKKYSQKPAMIVELKYDQSAQGAIAQIKEKNYVESLKEYQGNLLLVGINYDKKTGKHECVIEQFHNKKCLKSMN